MLPAGSYRPATSRVHYTTSCNTQSSAPEDGRDHHPKHVELIGIINKPLLLHLIGVYIIYNCSYLLCIDTTGRISYTGCIKVVYIQFSSQNRGAHYIRENGVH